MGFRLLLTYGQYLFWPNRLLLLYSFVIATTIRWERHLLGRPENPRSDPGLILRTVITHCGHFYASEMYVKPLDPRLSDREDLTFLTSP